MPRDVSLCSWALQVPEPEVLVIEDMTADSRCKPLVLCYRRGSICVFATQKTLYPSRNLSARSCHLPERRAQLP